MIDVERVQDSLAERRSGYSLPQAMYLDQSLYEADLEAVFAAEWLFACNGCEIPRPGDYVTFEVGRDPVIVLRDREGQIRAFHNSCRHRGSRVCQAEKGRATRLTCPYHQWVYDLDGSLRHARQMPDDFDKSDQGLAPIATEVICGMVYICLAASPPDISRFRAAVTPFIAPHQPDRVKVAHQTTLVENANWKLVIENNRECYHCAGNHPELLATLVEFALPDDEGGTEAFKSLMARKGAEWDAAGLPHAPADGGLEFPLHPPPLPRGGGLVHHGRPSGLPQAARRFHRSRPRVGSHVPGPEQLESLPQRPHHPFPHSAARRQPHGSADDLAGARGCGRRRGPTTSRS